MSTPKRWLEPGFVQNENPYIFVNFLSWPGVKIGHGRLLPGSATNKHLDKHHVFIPLAGSYEASMAPAGRGAIYSKRTVGQASIVPAGKQFSANWKEELEDLAIHFEPDFI